MSSSMKAAIHLGRNYTKKIGSIQVYELRGNLELIHDHAGTHIGTF